jgi:glutamine---fructose-6-phosphate transaminase (isomerizing)
MNISTPHMLLEIRETPQVVANLLAVNPEINQKLTRAIQDHNPEFAVTIARGTSDHAANFLKYALETQLGLVTASSSPSITTAYDTKLHLKRAVVIAISQSGQSPDVVNSLRAAREAGALTVALVNQAGSPLEEAAEFVLPMLAGEELAVAATKSFVASLVAPLQVIASLSQDTALLSALQNLPNALKTVLELEETAKDRSERYRYAEAMVSLARGVHFPMAQETALKLKETCVLQTEAFSTAEFAHGPIILIEPGFPVIAFQARDATAKGTLERYQDLAARGAELVLIGDDTPEIPASTRLNTPATGHRLTDPIVAIIAAYLFAGHLSLVKGLNPDSPRSLKKVTRTL